MSSIPRHLALILALGTFSTGCDFADIGRSIGDLFRSEQVLLVDGTDCETALDACLDAVYGDRYETDGDVANVYDEDEDACWDAYGSCSGEPPVMPPMDVCDSELEACLDEAGGQTDTGYAGADEMPPYGYDDQHCWDAYDDCVGDDSPGYPDEDQDDAPPRTH